MRRSPTRKKSKTKQKETLSVDIKEKLAQKRKAREARRKTDGINRFFLILCHTGWGTS
uniref:hypothetical protein n=1 Tax=Cyanothece sp. BG0011 TaxID=2082950 RepID=UPI0018E53DB1|nr:hypothetical protein [Cyanothece sp. BG0011]